MLAANPMIVFYGANGMSEACGVFFPTLALAASLRWYETRSITPLSIASFASMGAVLSRYELGIVPAVLLVGVVGVIALEERDWKKARAMGLYFCLAPAYGVGAWMFFNWTVQGSPLWFLKNGGQLATVAGTASTVGADTAIGGQARVVGAQTVLWAHAMFTPGLLFVVGGLVALAVWKREGRVNWFLLVVAVLVASNLITNLALVFLTGSDWLSNIRFNMRGIPLVLLAGGWVVAELGRRGARLAGWGAMTIWLALSALSMGTSAHAMQTAKLQFYERPFLHALAAPDAVRADTDSKQAVGCDGARAMGTYIRRNITSRNSIVADNSTSYAVLLFSGHPERFLDRIDKGDAYFFDQLARPGRRVRYLLASDGTNCSGVSGDLVVDRIVRDDGQLAHGIVKQHHTKGFDLYRVTTTLEEAD
jgi:hypothetical protein